MLFIGPAPSAPITRTASGAGLQAAAPPIPSHHPPSPPARSHPAQPFQLPLPPPVPPPLPPPPAGTPARSCQARRRGMQVAAGCEQRVGGCGRLGSAGKEHGEGWVGAAVSPTALHCGRMRLSYSLSSERAKIADLCSARGEKIRGVGLPGEAGVVATCDFGVQGRRGGGRGGCGLDMACGARRGRGWANLRWGRRRA